MSKIKTSKDIANLINKRMGNETVTTFDGENSVKVQPVSTGIPSLDNALGIGGFPLGRIVEIYGQESSGKTTLSLMTIATFQRLAKQEDHPLYGKKALFIDTEHALDPIHAQALGVDISQENGMIISQPSCGEEGYDLMEFAILTGEFGIIVGDSVPSFVPKKVIEGTAEDNFVGNAARLNSKMFSKISPIAHKNNCLVIMINQIREKVGVMHGKLSSLFKSFAVLR